MRKFYENNKILTILAVGSSAIILSHIWVNDNPKRVLYSTIYEIIYGLAMSLLASFIFFLVQIYFPEVKKQSGINENIRRRGYHIVNLIDNMIRTACKGNVELSSEDSFTEEEW